MIFLEVIKSVLFTVLLTSVAATAQAATGPSDGFALARKVESRFFSIEMAPGVEESALVSSLGISPDSHVLAGQSSPSLNSLGNLLDELFSWACRVLDMHLSGYRGTIKVVRDPSDLSNIYLRLYGVERKPEKAFYIYEINTLYVSEKDFTKEVVGHEIGHAIISNFFVVQAPEKIQEVLAGYVEYQLRKKPRP